MNATRIFRLLALGLLPVVFGCSSDEQGTLILQSASFPEIQDRTSEVTARLDIAGASCSLTVEADTTLTGSCPDLSLGTYTYTLTYSTKTGTVLAKAEGTVEIRSGSNGPITLAPLKTDYDDDGDGCTNLEEFIGPCPASFAPQVPILTGRQPQSVAVADLNRDGRPDLVVANSGDNSAVVLMGNGDGTFTTAAGSPLATGTKPRFVAIGDLNRDGNLDLVTANETAGTVSVLLGDGTGAFPPGAQNDFTVGTTPRSVAIQDLNNDGKADLAVANQGSNSVSVLLGDGSGGLAPETEFSTGTTPRSVVIGDLNGDGRPDLATANMGSSNVSVLLGDGAGGFAPGAQRDFPTDANPRAIALADLNGDGKLDLATPNYTSDTVSILLGRGDGSFSLSNLAVGDVPIFVAIADLNGDGKLDLAVSSEVSPESSVSILLGTGIGSFAKRGEFATGNQSHSVAIGDFNGDAKVDLVAANNQSGGISVLLNTTPF